MSKYFKNYHINGPVKIIRLEGKIGNINKVIYIFGDIHIDEKLQTECQDINKIDIDLFFKKTFKKVNKQIDFFVEQYISSIPWKDRPDGQLYKMRYISQVAKFAHTYFLDRINNRVSTSEIYQNVRFHHFDIRKTFFYKGDEMINFLSYFDFFHKIEIFQRKCNEYLNEIKQIYNDIENDEYMKKKIIEKY
jgi:hypothetical protein